MLGAGAGEPHAGSDFIVECLAAIDEVNRLRKAAERPRHEISIWWKMHMADQRDPEPPGREADGSRGNRIVGVDQIYLSTTKEREPLAVIPPGSPGLTVTRLMVLDDRAWYTEIVASLDHWTVKGASGLHLYSTGFQLRPQRKQAAIATTHRGCINQVKNAHRSKKLNGDNSKWYLGKLGFGTRNKAVPCLDARRLFPGK
jgi:hypothetical protein